MNLAEEIGRAMSDANKSHILTHQREMNFRELGVVAARVVRQRPDRYCTYCDKDVSPAPGATCPDCGNKTWETDSG